MGFLRPMRWLALFFDYYRFSLARVSGLCSICLYGRLIVCKLIFSFVLLLKVCDYFTTERSPSG